MTRLLALCADDFGAGAAVNRGILQLVASGRLSEVSCIVNGPAWPAAAPELAALPMVVEGRVRVGLHFNLTEGRPLAPALARHWPQLPALPALLLRAHLRRLPLAALQAELQAQLAAFEQFFGRAPQHIDGHQHVHHLPGVRELLLDVLAQRPGVRARHTGDLRGPGFAIKRRLIEHTGGRVLGPLLQAQGRAANLQLLGVYDFRRTDYPRLMQAWLAALPPRGGMVFCHPGDSSGDDAPADDGHDAIAAARRREFDYLGSDAFADDLAAADVKLAGRAFAH